MVHYPVFYDSGANNGPIKEYEEGQEAWPIHLNYEG
jgi:hypothetical protein